MPSLCCEMNDKNECDMRCIAMCCLESRTIKVLALVSLDFESKCVLIFEHMAHRASSREYICSQSNQPTTTKRFSLSLSFVCPIDAAWFLSSLSSFRSLDRWFTRQPLSIFHVHNETICDGMRESDSMRKRLEFCFYSVLPMLQKQSTIDIHEEKEEKRETAALWRWQSDGFVLSFLSQFAFT